MHLLVAAYLECLYRAAGLISSASPGLASACWLPTRLLLQLTPELGWYATVGDEAAQYAAPAMRPRHLATAAATARPSKGMKDLRTAGVSKDGVWAARPQW